MRLRKLFVRVEYYEGGTPYGLAMEIDGADSIEETRGTCKRAVDLLISELAKQETERRKAT